MLKGARKTQGGYPAWYGHEEHTPSKSLYKRMVDESIQTQAQIPPVQTTVERVERVVETPFNRSTASQTSETIAVQTESRPVSRTVSRTDSRASARPVFKHRQSTAIQTESSTQSVSNRLRQSLESRLSQRPVSFSVSWRQDTQQERPQSRVVFERSQSKSVYEKPAPRQDRPMLFERPPSRSDRAQSRSDRPKSAFERPVSRASTKQTVESRDQETPTRFSMQRQSEKQSRFQVERSPSKPVYPNSPATQRPDYAPTQKPDYSAFHKFQPSVSQRSSRASPERQSVHRTLDDSLQENSQVDHLLSQSWGNQGIYAIVNQFLDSPIIELLDTENLPSFEH
ncbi:hypothetical protein EDD86DRAFT_246119 [Gorgonomyces haynaldii]|nr:hypothetical protein EDD86DRAFT_246119 [Gorgonomyces haynaldii]